MNDDENGGAESRQQAWIMVRVGGGLSAAMAAWGTPATPAALATCPEPPPSTTFLTLRQGSRLQIAEPERQVGLTVL